MDCTLQSTWSSVEEFVLIELIQIMVTKAVDYDANMLHEYFCQLVAIKPIEKVLLNVKSVEQINSKITSIRNSFDVFNKLLKEQIKLNYECC